MRINDTFAVERKTEQRNYKVKFIIASEGSKSEPKYFEGISSNIISDNIKIYNLLRDYVNSNNSHPTHVVKLINDFMCNNVVESITVNELINKLLNWNHENSNKLDVNKLIDYLKNKYSLNEKIDYNILEKIILDLFKSEIYIDLAKNFKDYVISQNLTYDEKIDKLNIVIDRDEKSFLDYQYDEVVNFCNKNNINLYVSNPNFEFWLLLHFKEVENISKEELFQNKKISTKRNFLEKKLNDICGYNKNRFSFDYFQPYIKDAIKREKLYEESIIGLKNNLGTNVGKLVNEIISAK